MNKSVLITGAAYGIGAAAAKLFAKNGYEVLINYHTSSKQAEATVSECRSSGVQAWSIQGDVTNEDAVRSLVKQVTEKVGKLDVLINNAAFTDEPDFMEATKTDISHALEQNFVSAALVTRAFVPDHMKPKASVLNVASVYGLTQSGSPGLPIYSASKAAMINPTQTLAKIYAPGIRFNAVAPGYTDTPAWEGVSPKRRDAVVGSTLQKEWVMPEEIAEALLFLVQVPHINAETIVVDGGWSKKDNR